jgi:flagellar biosynthesis protein FlhB
MWVSDLWYPIVSYRMRQNTTFPLSQPVTTFCNDVCLARICSFSLWEYVSGLLICSLVLFVHMGKASLASYSVIFHSTDNIASYVHLCIYIEGLHNPFISLFTTLAFWLIRLSFSNLNILRFSLTRIFSVSLVVKVIKILTTYRQLSRACMKWRGIYLKKQ